MNEERKMSDDLDPDYVILKMGVQIDVRQLEGGYIVEGLKFKSGRKSAFAPEHLLSQEMDALLLTAFKKQIAEAFAAKPPQ